MWTKGPQLQPTEHWPAPARPERLMVWMHGMGSPGNLALEMEWARVAARRGGVRLWRTSRLRVIRDGPGVESPFPADGEHRAEPHLSQGGMPVALETRTARNRRQAAAKFPQLPKSGAKWPQEEAVPPAPPPTSAHTGGYIHCTHSPHAACTPQQGAPPPLCRL